MAPSGKSKGEEVTTSVVAERNRDAADARYSFDSNKLQHLRQESPWTKDAKFLKKVALSPTTVMKIMMHCQSGVEKGIAKGGNPVEVMGFLMGRPDPDAPDTLVVTDAFPLPIEGFETRVVADDENVVNHMISLGESLERTRLEKFMGWYHSHPFELGEHSHCFMSQTDITTQLLWQRSEDPRGNPFVAIVVDPLRSAHYEVPELKAFRAYPPDFKSSIVNECPDGVVESSEKVRLEYWGSCWDRYYELRIEYYMSSTSRKVLESLTQDYLWMRTLLRQPSSVLTQQLETTAKAFANASNAVPTSTVVVSAHQGGTSSASTSATSSASSRLRGAGMTESTMAPPGTSTSKLSTFNPRSKEWTKAINQLVDVASEELCETSLQLTKQQIFGEC